MCTAGDCAHLSKPNLLFHVIGDTKIAAAQTYQALVKTAPLKVELIIFVLRRLNQNMQVPARSYFVERTATLHGEVYI